MTELRTTFQYDAVAEAYQHRPPYPDEVFDHLEALVVDEPRNVLDIGAGEGAIARPLAPRVDRVDAIDMSQAMVDVGRRRPGGDRANLHWHVSSIETADLNGPYALVTAGASIHWMPWEETFNRIVPHLTQNAQLAIVEHGPVDVPWGDELLPVIKKHTRNPGYDPTFDIVDAIRDRGLLDLTDQKMTAPVTQQKTVADYIEWMHSTSTLARDLMSAEEAAEFDTAVHEVLTPYARDGVLELTIVAQLSWGRPKASQPGTEGSAAPAGSE